MAAVQIHDQTNILPRTQLLIVFAALALTLLISYIDQSAIGTALPTIGTDLNASSTIVWAGTSSMIANTVFQVLYGRLSDIFGRKVVMLCSLALLCLGDLLCGFAKTAAQLYAFRGLAGVANGGIMACCMMIVSDIVTLEERGKYQGILGSMVGLGNILGPFIGAGFIQSASWRYLFFFVAPLAAIAATVIFIILPKHNMPKDGFLVKVAKIDFLGIVFSSAGICLLLIPLSGIGSYFNSRSPMVISMLTLGSVSAVLFLVIECKVAKLPMIPPRLFKTPPLCAMLAQNVLIGITYYGMLYYLPIYYQSVRGFSPLTSAVLMVPLVAAQSLFSSLAGFYISKNDRYGEVLWLGYICWMLGAGLHCLFSLRTPIVGIIFIMITEGVGVGFIFQPSLIAAQAHCLKEDRAVVISTRNFLRSMGGAVGLAIASLIFVNTLKSALPASIPAEVTARILDSVFSPPNLSGLSDEQKQNVSNAYVAAIRSVFYLWAASIGICLLLMIFIKDHGLKRRDEEEHNDSPIPGEPKIGVHSGDPENSSILKNEKIEVR